MTTNYWCPWCGETATGQTRDERIQCMRCVREFYKLFRFWAEAAMTPLEDGEEPGAPESSKRVFTFRESGTGKLVGRTRIAPARARRASER